MADIFLKIVNMSISASWIVLAVLVLRLLLKKAPKWITVLLWGIVAIRLICPFSIESVMSLIPSTETISPEIMMDKTPTINSGVPIINNIVNPVIGESFAPDPIASANPLQILIPVLAIAWAAGIIVMLAYTAISYFRVKSKIGTAVLFRDNIYQSENVVSPFVLGIIKPKIYLPFNMNEQDMEHVIAHENAHIHRKDHWWKPFGFLVLTLHWFNPLMWLGYVLLCRDIELACDEKVVKEFDNEQKADYSQALLTCSVNRRIIAACPLAFGEVGVKNRVKSVLHYKKPAFWIVVTAVVASIVVAVCFLTNPKEDAELGIFSQKSGSDLNGVSLEIVDADLSAPDPYVVVEWKNDTDIKLSFGEQFVVYYNQGNTWENCGIEKDPVWNLIAYMFDANSTVKHRYKLNGQIMTHPGKYKFEAPFTIDGKNETKYSAWIEFELKEGVEGITVHTFKPIELVYDDGMYSFVQTVEGAPTYMIVNGMQLIEKTDDTVSEPIGTFEEITLNKDNFDSRFRGPTDYSWLANDTLKSLKDNNKRIWQLYGDSAAETPCLYILLEQKDGTFYLGFGYYNCNSTNPTNPDDSHIRWLYKLEEVAGNNNILTNNTPLSNFQSLKEKYPQFFNVSTDGGLTVYIWQMSENNYSCYLANTSMEAISDNSFAYNVGATIAEMRAILTTYDIEQKDITVQPVINPLSSYGYRIDDAYRAKIKELFWENSYNVIDYDGSSIPKLNVTCGNASTEASMGTTEWTFEVENGMMQTINGDSSHPLERMEYLLPLALKVNRSNNATPSVGLNFNVAPDSIKVDSWFLTENGKTKSFDAEVDGFNIKLNAGKETCIYEVVATWNKSAKYYGTVRYSFCVVESSSPSNQVYDVALSFANWTDNSKIYTSSLNLSKMQSNSIQHLPIYKFDSLKDLKQFKESFGDILTMDSGWDEVPSFNETTAKYDAKFFEKNSLMLVYVSASNCTHRFGLGSIHWDKKSFCINVVETTGKEMVDEAMAGWFLTVAVEKESIASCTEFDANLNNEIKLY